MKISTTITAALLALGIVSQASAQTVVYLTGSTAFRSTVYAALDNNGGPSAGGVFDTGTLVGSVTYGNATAASANYMVFEGKVNGNLVYVDCAWSGSEAGIASAADTTVNNDGLPLPGSPAHWLNVSKVTLDGTAHASNPPNSLMETNADGTLATHGADLAQADTSQAVSQTPYVANTPTALTDFGSEGVVTFSWAKNINTDLSGVAGAAYSRFKNISVEQAFVEFSGPQPAGFFTGNTNDDNVFVYLVGRNKGSGTRANTLADTGYGTHTPVSQFSIGGGVTNSFTGNLNLASVGDNGYDSGGILSEALAIPGSCQQPDPIMGPLVGETNGWIAIGYSSPADLLNHNVTTNYWLTEDGVMESDGAIEEGQYSFWGHEHLYGKENISGIQQQVGTALFNAVKTTLSLNQDGANPAAHDPGIAYSYMRCTKASDVAYPVHN